MNMRNKFYIIAFIIGLIFLLLNILTPETGTIGLINIFFNNHLMLHIRL